MKKAVLFLMILLSWGHPADATAKAKAEKPVRVACVGNSITYGMKLPDRETQSYPVRLQEMLGDGYEVGNFGRSGATLLEKGHNPYVKTDEYQQALEFAGDIVVIHLGVNDTDPRNWPNYKEEFVGDYIRLIESFRAQNPGCRIIIAKLSPIGAGHPRFISGTQCWREDIQKAIETVIQVAGTEWVDFEKPLYAYPHLLPDEIHPNPEGAWRLACAAYSAITGDFGGLQMPDIYTDGMVLQRGDSLRIAGTADAKSRIKISIDKQSGSTEAGADGQWEVKMPAPETGGPYVLTITDGDTKLRYEDVLVGDVWICSGQSNMEFEMRRAKTAASDIPSSACGEIRLFDQKARWRTDAVQWSTEALDSVNALEYFKQTSWKAATKETVADFSAVAYYFGKMLQDSLQVPIGLICNAVGGSPAEAWVDRQTLEEHFPAILKDWKGNDFIQPWVRERAAVNITLSEDKKQRHPYEPCYLFEAGIMPLGHFPVKGVIWYQGESNAHNLEAHEILFPLLVDSWREYWQDEDLPFYYVQLSSINRPSWPSFRDSQRRLMQSIPNVGMAVSSDKGDSLDVHPRDKKPIGERLARIALSQTYHCQDIVPSGPLFRSARRDGNAVEVEFDYGEDMQGEGGKPIISFEVAEYDGLYKPAEAVVSGDGKLKVSSKEVDNPRYIRYGWQPFTRANLVNGCGLPASTFSARVE